MPDNPSGGGYVVSIRITCPTCHGRRYVADHMAPTTIETDHYAFTFTSTVCGTCGGAGTIPASSPIAAGEFRSVAIAPAEEPAEEPTVCAWSHRRWVGGLSLDDPAEGALLDEVADLLGAGLSPWTIRAALQDLAGRETVACSTCEGTGHETGAYAGGETLSRVCPTCNGSGRLAGHYAGSPANLAVLRETGQIAAPMSVYRERAYLVAHLTRLYPWSIGEDPEGEDGYRTVVHVSTPAGQLGWHFADEDVDVLDRSTAGDRLAEYDGHTTAEKYDRLARLPMVDRDRIPVGNWFGVVTIACQACGGDEDDREACEWCGGSGADPAAYEAANGTGVWMPAPINHALAIGRAIGRGVPAHVLTSAIDLLGRVTDDGETVRMLLDDVVRAAVRGVGIVDIQTALAAADRSLVGEPAGIGHAAGITAEEVDESLAAIGQRISRVVRGKTDAEETRPTRPPVTVREVSGLTTWQDLGGYIAYVMDHLGLAEYLCTLYEEPLSNGDWGQAAIGSQRRTFELKLAGNWREWQAEDMRSTIVHEVLHLYTDPIVRAYRPVRKMITRDAWRAVDAAGLRTMELATDGIEGVLSRSIALPGNHPAVDPRVEVVRADLDTVPEGEGVWVIQPRRGEGPYLRPEADR